MFCISCGSFIAIGSRTKALAAAQPFSGPPPVPGDADVDVSLPLVAGVAPLGSYSVEAQRRATRRTRTMTAVASVVMAMVVGGAAIYLASPLSDRGGVPETAAVVPASAMPQPTDQTAGVSGISIEPQTVLVEPEPVVAQPEPVVEEPEPVVEEPAAVIESEPIGAEPAQPVEPVRPVEPAPVRETEPVVEAVPAAQPQRLPETEQTAPESTVEEAAVPTDAAAPPRPAVREAQDTPVTTAGGWVCEGAVTIDDSRVREWSLGRVSFRVRPGFERVVLQLERAGPGSGAPASLTAAAVPTTRVRGLLPGVRMPASGKTTIGLQLDDGFAGNLALRGYNPSGLVTIKEFSVYPSGRDGKDVLISAVQDACFRVRVPAWSDPSNSLRRAQILIDVKP